MNDVYDMDLFNVVFGSEIMALPSEYALLDLELTNAHDVPPTNVDFEHVLNGTQGWAIHFSAGKPMVDGLGPQHHPGAKPAYHKLLQLWYTEAEHACPSNSYAESGFK
jgi:hypothetical protein